MSKTKEKKQKMSKRTILIAILAIAIFCVGGFARLWQLETIPPGLQYDEAYNGLDALGAVQTSDFQLFYSDNNGREGFYINVVGIFLKYFGVNNFAVRFASAMFGILTLVGFFFLSRELRLSWLTTIMGTFMMSFSFWHINFSRIVYRGIMVPFLLVWIFFFFFRGLRTRKIYNFVLSGLLTGLGFHTYISFRIVPLIFVIITIFLFFMNINFFKKYWKSALVFILAAMLSAAPLVLYFVDNPLDFTGRSGAVSVFNSPEMSFPQALGKSMLYHLGAFFVYGDPNQRHNHGALPLLPTAWGILFAFGFLISLKEIFLTIVGRFKKTRSCRLCHASILGQSIFWVMLIPGVMSIEGIPHSLRIIGAIPGVFLLTALSFEYLFKIYNSLQQSKLLSYKLWRWTVLKVALLGLVATVLLSGFSQLYLYFDVWAKEPKTAESLERELFDLGKTIAELEKRQQNFLVVSPEVGIFEEHQSSSLKTTEFAGHPNIQDYFFYQPVEGLAKIPCENSQIVFHKSDAWLRTKYEEKCPNLSFSQFIPQNGLHSFWVLH